MMSNVSCNNAYDDAGRGNCRHPNDTNSFKKTSLGRITSLSEKNTQSFNESTLQNSIPIPSMEWVQSLIAHEVRGSDDFSFENNQVSASLFYGSACKYPTEMVDLPPNKSHYWFEQNADVNSVPKETSVNCHSNQGQPLQSIVLPPQNYDQNFISSYHNAYQLKRNWSLPHYAQSAKDYAMQNFAHPLFLPDQRQFLKYSSNPKDKSECDLQAVTSKCLEFQENLANEIAGNYSSNNRNCWKDPHRCLRINPSQNSNRSLSQPLTSDGEIIKYTAAGTAPALSAYKSDFDEVALCSSTSSGSAHTYRGQPVFTFPDNEAMLSNGSVFQTWP
ncbi:unnamed protein product [Dracunculus medinensis]|uniref:Protein aurora borealis n=1 Tax=Dracunculus medinensis TaxID=318479 RepID=A0A0N4ULF0_DRAME|nr:unnamed protein product [Dracunculus medinensis]